MTDDGSPAALRQPTPQPDPFIILVSVAWRANTKDMTDHANHPQQQGPPTAKRKLDLLSSPPRTQSLAKKATATSASASVTAPAVGGGVRRANLLDVSGVRERSSRDEIHGNISMEPALTALIDTPYFQRLRQVRQLGATPWVS